MFDLYIGKSEHNGWKSLSLYWNNRPSIVLNPECIDTQTIAIKFAFP